MMKYLVALFILANSHFVFAQSNHTSSFYRKRADSVFQRVWKLYAIPNQPGLFKENYPSGGDVKLDYFQGAEVGEKPVSFLWPFSGMYSAANVLVKFSALEKKYQKYLDTLAKGVLAYRDTSRLPVGYQAYPAILEKSDRYYDDNALVCIDYSEAYLNTKDEKYIDKAKEVFDFIISGWDDKLSGGVYWLEGHFDHKPACTNGMSTLAALKLYKCTKDPKYLDWGKRFYQWMHDHLRNPKGIYYNDIKMDGKINEVYYTYNTGSMLEASVMLYHFTKENAYLEEAKLVAENAYTFFSKTDAYGNVNLTIDLPWFVTVLFRGYEALYQVDHQPKYINAVADALNKAWTNAADRYGLLTAKWATTEQAKRKPKWLLDQACIAELYARLSLLNINAQK